MSARFKAADSQSAVCVSLHQISLLASAHFNRLSAAVSLNAERRQTALLESESSSEELFILLE